MTGTPEHRAWKAAIGRCHNPRNRNFKWYGGKGVKVCASWRDSFATFYRDVGPRPSQRHSLDRFPNPEGDYEPGNCRWTIQKDQVNNRTNCPKIKYKGRSQTLSQWAEEFGINPTTAFHRRQRGWSIHRTLTWPVGVRRRKKGSCHPDYYIWSGMHTRCYNRRCREYRHYGGKGVYVCDRWRSRGRRGAHSREQLEFKAFLEDMGPRPSPAHSLERINVEGPYSPDNCRWATNAEQIRNRRITRFKDFKGEKVCFADLAKRHGLCPATLRWRLDRGWPLEEALTTPPGEPRPGRRKGVRASRGM